MEDIHSSITQSSCSCSNWAPSASGAGEVGDVRTDHVWNSVGNWVDVITIWAYHGAVLYMNLCASHSVQICHAVGALPLIRHDLEPVKILHLHFVAQELEPAETRRQADERSSNAFRSGDGRHTDFAVSTSAFHSNLGMKPLKKSGLYSASRRSTRTSVKMSGKLFEVHPRTWQARRLWVISLTISDVLLYLKGDFIRI